MLREDANPIEMAVALLDDTSVGLAHRLQEFNMLKESSEQALRSVVNEHYDLFNKSMGSYNTLLSTMKTLRKTLWKSRTFWNTPIKKCTIDQQCWVNCHWLLPSIQR